MDAKQLRLDPKRLFPPTGAKYRPDQRKRKSPVSGSTARTLIIFEMQKEIHLDANGKIHERFLTAREIAEKTGLPRDRVTSELRNMITRGEVTPYLTYSRKFRLVRFRPVFRPGRIQS